MAERTVIFIFSLMAFFVPKVRQIICFLYQFDLVVK